MRTLGIVGRQRESAREQLDQAAAPEEPLGRLLVALVPLVVERLEEAARPVELGGPEECARKVQARPQLLLRVGGRACQLVGRLGKPERIRLPGVKANRRERAQRSRTQRVVLEALCELERGACMARGDAQAFGEDQFPGQPLVNQCLQGRMIRRLAKSLAVQFLCAPELDFGEEDEHLGALLPR